jgi:hypothetical protein
MQSRSVVLQIADEWWETRSEEGKKSLRLSSSND